MLCTSQQTLSNCVFVLEIPLVVSISTVLSGVGRFESAFSLTQGRSVCVLPRRLRGAHV